MFSLTSSTIPGKSNHSQWLPLSIHLQDTVSAMQYLLTTKVSASTVKASGLTPSAFRSVALFLSAAHDIGKSTAGFLYKILPELPDIRTKLEQEGIHIDPVPEIDWNHALAGECILEFLGVNRTVAVVVGMHHGAAPSGDAVLSGIEDVQHNYAAYVQGDPAMWRNVWEEVLTNALDAGGYRDVSELPILSESAQMLFGGLVSWADWLASNRLYFPLLPTTENTVERKQRDVNAKQMLRLGNRWCPDAGMMLDVYQERFGFRPNEMQTRVVDDAAILGKCKMIIIEAPMGSGKTEASLAVAELMAQQNGCSGIFYGLPTMATSNAIFDRIKTWLTDLHDGRGHTLQLAHSRAEWNDSFTDLRTTPLGDVFADPWFSGSKKSILSDFVVGTCDGALMSVRTAKYIDLRHLSLSGKVTIIDECHAYDTFTDVYLMRMLEWLGVYHAPVILLSATLPLEKRRQMLEAYTNRDITLPDVSGYPLITCVDESGEVYAHAIPSNNPPITVTTRRLARKGLVESLRRNLVDGGCAGVIVNTVKAAQETAQELRSAFPDKTVLLYHSHYTAADRATREAHLLDLIGKHSAPDSRNGLIIVGTQVLEQSLDIDFDVLYTELCPMDLLMQRIGRLHRHNRTRPHNLKKPVCYVVPATYGGTSVYGKWLLKVTDRHLPSSVNIPSDIPTLVNTVYSDTSNGSDPDELDYRRKCDGQAGRAEVPCFKSPSRSGKRMKTLLGAWDGALDNGENSSVRDIGDTLEVCLLEVRQTPNGLIAAPFGKPDGFRLDTVPDPSEFREILKQRISIPHGVMKDLRDAAQRLDADGRLGVWRTVLGEERVLLVENGRSVLGEVWYDENGLVM